jgi:hypothetical protein
MYPKSPEQGNSTNQNHPRDESSFHFLPENSEVRRKENHDLKRKKNGFPAFCVSFINPVRRVTANIQIPIFEKKKS